MCFSQSHTPHTLSVPFKPQGRPPSVIDADFREVCQRRAIP
jgi:hypothetical protein